MKNNKTIGLKDSLEAISNSFWKYNEFLISNQPRDKIQALKISLQYQFMFLNNLLEELPYDKKSKAISKILGKSSKCVKEDLPIAEEDILDLEYMGLGKEF